MKQRMLLAACVLLWATSALAQAGGAAGDPVTGRWGTSGITFLELQFDGKSTVTGTTIWREGGAHEQRAAIEKGTFDHGTRTLRLSGAIERNGKKVRYEIQGTIQDDTFTGTSSVRNEKKRLAFTRQ